MCNSGILKSNSEFAVDHNDLNQGFLMVDAKEIGPTRARAWDTEGLHQHKT